MHNEPAHAVAAERDHSHDLEHVRKAVKWYLLVGLVLFFCTALTVGLSYVDFGTPKANIVVAMIVATVKAGAVAAVFMHLASERWTIYRFLLVTCVFAIGLFALSLLAFHDHIHQ
ncbi:MAG: cytochrome C oxidase subunit IV family protein [Verrucomicrobiota bacterium]|nr:cytochrome C oxidase subunit IV family protein [Verrucomicrobiota bacterium]